MKRPDRFEALDAWRGICALLVAVEHLNVDSVLHHNELIHHSYRFVDFFFVLSGFVIAHAYRDRIAGWRDARSFLVRRIGRLWPLHVTMLVAFVVFDLGVRLAVQRHVISASATFSERNSWSSLPANVFLVQSWGILDRTSWNAPSWSISTEMFAYGLFAAICAALPRRWLTWVAGILVVGCATVIAAALPYTMKATFDYGLLRCVPGFMAGVLVRRLFELRQPRLGTAGELGAVATVIAGVIWLPGTDAPSLLVIPIFGFVVWVFASEDGALSRALRRPWPQRLGAWSYSIYMVHAFLVLCLLGAATMATKAGLPVFARVDTLATIVGPAPFTAAVLVLYLALVILAARLTYRHVELRGQAWVQARSANVRSIRRK